MGRQADRQAGTWGYVSAQIKKVGQLGVCVGELLERHAGGVVQRVGWWGGKLTDGLKGSYSSR